MNIEFDHKLDPLLGRIEVVPQDIGRVFMNVLTNAFEALRDCWQDDRSFRPLVRVESHRTKDFVEIRISDNGRGVPKEIQDKIFNPRETGEGAGLGLSMSYEIVAAHGGALELDTQIVEGASFVIRLPN